MSSSARKRKRRGMIIVLSGPSGVGKSSICSALLKSDRRIRYSVSATTRPPRRGERNGRDYLFLTPGRFKALVARRQLLEYARVHGELYGTPRHYVARRLAQGYDVLLDIDVQGGRQLRKTCPDALFIFVTAPSMAELERRLRHRGADAPATIRQRPRVARQELKQARFYSYCVRNRDLDKTVALIHAIIKVERCGRGLKWQR